VVLAPADRVVQVIDNLLTNAVSFSPSGGVVTVSVRRAETTLLLEVADRGPGIPEEHLDRLFTRFFSYRPDEQDSSSHTGLGLAIVRAIVEGVGGAVSARNRSERGAVFTVVLPRVER